MAESTHSAELEHTGRHITCHDPAICEGWVCSLHHRTEHSMRAFPQHYRIVAAVGATGLVLLAAWTAAVIDAVLAIWEDGP